MDGAQYRRNTPPSRLVSQERPVVQLNNQQAYVLLATTGSEKYSPSCVGVYKLTLETQKFVHTDLLRGNNIGTVRPLLSHTVETAYAPMAP